MDKYTVVYTDADDIEHTMAISASVKIESDDDIIFKDQNGEDGYVFVKANVISTILIN